MADRSTTEARQLIESQIDPVFQAAIDSQRVPGVAAIALDASGEVLFSRGYGVTTFGDPNAPKITTSTPAYIYSCTKLLTSIAALQLIEQQQLKLDDLVEDHVPTFAKLQVLEKIEDGKPVLRAPQTKAKVVHLLTHTAGCTYDFFDSNTLQWRMANGQQPATYGTNTNVEFYSTPLKFDPGQSYNYGVNTDWLGLVVEKVSNLRIDEYIEKHITGPLGLKDTRYGNDGEKAFFNVHLKDADGKLTPVPNLRHNIEGELVPGGQYLTSTAEDYAQILLTILNHGTHPTSRISLLKSTTVKEFIFTDQLTPLGISNAGVGKVSAALPMLSTNGEFLPGITKGWSLGLLTNSEDLPNGRKAGSGFWSGLSNSYYWMAPSSGKLGFVLGASFPWYDRDVLHLVDALERAVYARPPASIAGEEGSNFVGGEIVKV